MTETILHDDSVIPSIEMPSPTEKEDVKSEPLKVVPSTNKNRDIIILIVLIVLIIGAFFLLNYLNNKKIAAAIPTT